MSEEFQPWIPHVGRNFEKTQLLLLGESAYSWEDPPKSGNYRVPELRHPQDMVKYVTCNFPKDRFITCLTRGITGEESPEKEKMINAWDRVAFTNYVPGSVGKGPRSRPSREQWEAAQGQWKELLNKIRPRRVIVVGKTAWGEMPETQLGFCEDVQGYSLDDESKVICWAVDHPRHGLRWRRLAAIIQFSLWNELK